jgi:hypothetical protein
MSSSRRAEADLPSSMALILKRFHSSLSTSIVVLYNRRDMEGKDANAYIRIIHKVIIMHQAYRQPAARVAETLPAHNTAREAALSCGKEDDWGKTMPFWCLGCGQGFVSVKRVFSHYAKAGHGNETMSVGSRGLTKKQQVEAFRLRNK